MSPSQASIGVSGLTTSAWNVPPRNLKDVVGRLVVISLTSRHRRAVVVNGWLICGVPDAEMRSPVTARGHGGRAMPPHCSPAAFQARFTDRRSLATGAARRNAQARTHA